ncbi:MAG: hypothetical protein ACLGIN_17715, partial [Candidatus Sericytochromatia bacterium]
MAIAAREASLEVRRRAVEVAAVGLQAGAIVEELRVAGEAAEALVEGRFRAIRPTELAVGLMMRLHVLADLRVRELGEGRHGGEALEG